MPSIILGKPIRSVQATANLGRLISASKLPASEKAFLRKPSWIFVRDDFTQARKDPLAKRAGYLCSSGIQPAS